MYCIDQGGNEPAVLCIHGYCQSSAYWAPSVKRLGEVGRRALAPDLPGFGASASLPGPYTLPAYADRLAEFLNAHGLGRIVLVGGSMGGVVAQYFALSYPVRLTRMLLVATGAFTTDPGAAMSRAKALAETPWNEEAVRPIVTGFFHEPPPSSQLAEFRRIALMASHRAAVEAARSNAESRAFDRLDEITVPTLIIQGRHDRARTPDHGALMRDRIPGARLEVLENCGHTPQLEDPEAFHNIALPFLLAGR